MRATPNLRLRLLCGIASAACWIQFLAAQPVTAEANSFLSNLWTSSAADTLLPALDLYTQDRIGNSAKALRRIEKNEDKQRTLDVLEQAAKRPDFWENAVTAGARDVKAVSDFAGGKIKSEAQLFALAE